MDPPRLLLALPRGGRFGLAASAGADSTALLRLCLERRPDLVLHVVHLDHEARGEASAADAAFVRDLADAHGLPSTIARRRDVEPLLPRRPANRSALFRALRHALFRRACAEHALAGILLGHHADDQAETVLHRLLRGSGPTGLAGMMFRTELVDAPGRHDTGAAPARAEERTGEAPAPRQRASPLILYRPLLETPAADLRAYLRSMGQPWLEDASNASDAYARNRLRRLLRGHPDLAARLRALASACAAYRDALRSAAPDLTDPFPGSILASLPAPVAAEAARRFLLAAGVPAEEIAPATLARLLAFATDAASPPRLQLPGLTLHRRRGHVGTRPRLTHPAPGA